MPPCWAQAHSVGRTKQATHSRPAHTGPGTPIPLAGQTTHHKWPALSCFMPTGEEHADECTWWLLGIKRERTSARPPSPKAREEAVEASDSFFQKEETRGEDAWTVLLERKKRTKRMLGPLFPKGRNERRGCLDYSTKKDWKGWRAALEGFLQGSGSKRAAHSKTSPEPVRRFAQTSDSGKAGRCTGHRSALHRPTQGAA